jgi:hypothetical protein
MYMKKETRHNRVELTEDLYNEISKTWKQKQDVAKVADALGLLWSTVNVVVEHGIPDLGLAPLPKSNGKSAPRKTRTKKIKPKIVDSDLQKAAVLANNEAVEHVNKAKAALKEVEQKAKEVGQKVDLEEQQQRADGTMDEIQLATKRANLESKRLANVGQRAITADATKRSAEEAALARRSMDLCLDIGAVMSRTIETLMEGIEAGNIDLPDKVDLKTLSTLATSADRLTAAIERAIKIEKGRAGEPDTVLGVQIGLLLDMKSDDELDTIIQNGVLDVKSDDDN